MQSMERSYRPKGNLNVTHFFAMRHELHPGWSGSESSTVHCRYRARFLSMKGIQFVLTNPDPKHIIRIVGPVARDLVPISSNRLFPEIYPKHFRMKITATKLGSAPKNPKTPRNFFHTGGSVETATGVYVYLETHSNVAGGAPSSGHEPDRDPAARPGQTCRSVLLGLREGASEAD